MIDPGFSKQKVVSVVMSHIFNLPFFEAIRKIAFL